MKTDERVEYLCEQMDIVVSDLQKLKRGQDAMTAAIASLTEQIARLNNRGK